MASRGISRCKVPTATDRVVASSQLVQSPLEEGTAWESALLPVALPPPCLWQRGQAARAARGPQATVPWHRYQRTAWLPRGPTFRQPAARAISVRVSRQADT